MVISEALILRFLNGNCNAEEAGAVLSYLESHPEAMEQYLGQEARDQVRTSAAGPTAFQSRRMLENIQHALSEKPVRDQFWRYIGVAAALLMIAGTLFFLPRTKTKVPQQTPTYAVRWKLIRNEAVHTMNYQLEDGSEVDLDPGSSIAMPEHFRADRRDIKLVGRALFEVAKDSKRPFTVMAENISTRALGTKFLINAQISRPTTEVTLLEGSVMISVADKQKGSFNQYYLNPDQQLIHTRQSGSILIKPMKDESRTGKVGNRAIAVQKADRAAAMTFYRAPLTEVFQTLEQSYNVHIDYQYAGLHNHYFTGSFLAEETLQRMLQVISEVNNLEFRKTRSGYQVIKNQE